MRPFGGDAVFEIQALPRAAKGVPLDLHPDAFGPDDVAVTIIAHIGAIVWREGGDCSSIAVSRGCAGSFWHWLSASAAEFGLEAS